MMMTIMSEALIFKLNQAITPAQQAEYLAPGATDEEIRSFRESVGLLSEQLPESFYAFYRQHNGSNVVRHSYVPFHDREILLSLDKIAGRWRNWNQAVEKGYLSRYVDGAWWDAAWVPYIETSWYVQVVDTRGSFGGQPGQILSFDFKNPSDRIILHASFDQWLISMLALVEADLWRPGELSDEQYEAQDGEYLTSEERQRADRIIDALNPGYPWAAELHRYRKAAVENAPNPHWAELEEAIKSDDLASVQRLVEEKRIAVSEQNAHEVE